MWSQPGWKEEIDKYDPTLLVNRPWVIYTYIGNGESQILQILELRRIDGEESVRIENSAGGIRVSVVGIGGQVNESATYEMSFQTP